MSATYIKDGETQEQAIKRLMAARRRELRSDGKTAGDFPKWKPGMTTAHYICLFAIRARETVLPYGLSRYERPAPYLAEPEVTEEVAA